MRPLRIYAVLCCSTACLALAGCSFQYPQLSLKEVLATGTTNALRTTEMQEPITSAVTLHEALARAIKYNLDYRLEMRLGALRDAEIQQAKADMLPRLVAQAGFSERNNDLVTSSLDIPTGIEFSPNTTSEPRYYQSGDVTTSWDMLDFALSYVRAKQAADKYLIQQEMKRKVIERIVEDTRTAYWRAVSADRMSRKLAQLNERVRHAIAGLHQVQQQGADAPLTALANERELVQIQRSAESLQHELNLAKAQLATLMNVAPGTKFFVADKDPQTAPAVIDLSAKDMVAEAIFNRPEIREVAYEKRITEGEATAAILELIPSIKDYGLDAFNDNHFLLNNNWLGWGAAIGGNLVKLAQLPERQSWIAAEGATLDQRALATTMVVMTQVFVSRTRYRHITDELASARDYAQVQSDLVDKLRAEAAAGTIGEQTLIREEMNLLVAEVERDVTTADLENASANIIASMGLDLQPKDVDMTLSVRTLANVLKERMADRIALSDRGKYLMEIEKEKEQARRKAAEAERLRQAEIARVAAEAQAVKDAEIAQAREEIRLAKVAAAQEKAETLRAAAAEALRIKQEAKAAADEAKRLKDEELRAKAEDARQHAAEVAIAKKEAQLAALEAQRAAKLEAARLKAEAVKARDDAKRARHDALLARKAGKAAGSSNAWTDPWQSGDWVWPWEGSKASPDLPRKRKK